MTDKPYTPMSAEQMQAAVDQVNEAALRMAEATVTIPQRMGLVQRVSEEMLASSEGFRQLGHYETVTPTPEQIAQHARAQELVREIEENPYVYIGGYDDYEVSVEPLQTRRWVFDETNEEWLERWRASKEES